MKSRMKMLIFIRLGDGSMAGDKDDAYIQKTWPY